MIKLVTMEAESENTENCLIFWNLLNQVISSLLSSKRNLILLVGASMKQEVYGRC